MIRFVQNFVIPCYDTDAAWRLKPSAFMNLAQEAAGQHAVYLGFGYDDLIVSNTAWILSRLNIKFLDTPLWRDEITLTTWHKGLNRLFYIRDFVLTDKDGKERVKATTSWLVMNLENRRLVRDPKLVDMDGICTYDAIETPADKVQMPKDIEAEYVMDHRVSYSDVDTNGHTNNAMYMQWAMDTVEYEIASTRPVKEVTINFNHETKAGDKVVLFKAVKESDGERHVFVEGRVADASAFCVEIVF